MDNPLEGLTEGRTVIYVLDRGPRAGENRPALVVRVWRRQDGEVREAGLCQLAVFLDGANDDWDRCVLWAPSVAYDAGGQRGTWHWPAPMPWSRVTGGMPDVDRDQLRELIRAELAAMRDQDEE